MNYITIDFKKAWENAMLTYLKEGGDILFPGDEKEMLLRCVLEILIQERASLNAALQMSTVRDATGAYLDAVGEEEGVSRKQAEHARGELQVIVDMGQKPRHIPEGTLFSYGAQITFVTEKYAGAPVGTGTKELTIPIRCAEAGKAGNALKEGTPLSAVEPVAYIRSAKLTKATEGGAEREDDEAYRQRIIESTFRQNATGSRAQYRAVALSVSTAILDASPVSDEKYQAGTGKEYGLKPGEVLVTLLYKEGTEKSVKSRIEQEVWIALNADSSRPMTDTVIVRESTPVPFALKVRYQLKEQRDGKNLRADVQAAADAYREWQTKSIGLPFDPYRLTSMLYSAGCRRVDIVQEESNVNGQAAVYTEIPKNKHLTGTVLIEEMVE